MTSKEMLLQFDDQYLGLFNQLFRGFDDYRVIMSRHDTFHVSTNDRLLSIEIKLLPAGLDIVDLNGFSLNVAKQAIDFINSVLDQECDDIK